MSLVDLSQYDKPTTNAQTNHKVELIDNLSGERRTIVDTGEGSERLMIDFLKGRRKLESIPKISEVTEAVSRQDLMELGIPLPEV